ncbi:MAG: nitroreductase family protein [Bacteriovoracaceae bacterium]
MNSINEIIKTRRTIHKFLNQRVNEDELLDCLEASLCAPNHKLTDPVRYYLAGEQTRKNVFDFLVETKQNKSGPLDENQMLSFEQKFINPSHLVIISQALNPDPLTSKEDYATVACSVHNLSLLLWEKGIGLKWSTGKKIKSPKLHEITNIDIQKESIEGLLWIGIPKLTPPSPPRAKLNELLKRLN